MKSKWWHRWFLTPGELSTLGVVGINARNGRYLLPNNSRKYYPSVDDKVMSKRLAQGMDIPVPDLYGTIESPGDLRKLGAMLQDKEAFVIKPARGSGGKGVLVIQGRSGDAYLKGSGTSLTLEEIRFHTANILGGLFSLGGQRDVAMVEQYISCADEVMAMSYRGAPDVRVVMLHGYPVMAMLRVATKESDGRANLHQGAIGIGIDLETGITHHAVCHGHPIEIHPDLESPLIGQQIPDWDTVLKLAGLCYEMTHLGYLGADIMIGKELGPMIIEINARPGLAIQLANGEGLRNRFQWVHEEAVRMQRTASLEERIDFSRGPLMRKARQSKASLAAAAK
ncbi:alpha-L-glutamate ligase-like protein [Roseibacillus ishigakijimensis]|uniref:Alpha-L-glutamate ligase-like protein n=1 Tax=Roseibacillus ishigakijimensis TaxID=454146 RepID=A0A934RR05_9BACT|nr:alpha-L-glutamate ligase-like protein [Roseibacillus ishigakijimensis]MBK1833469.1 alpha-L-glutamate ligase-like protein [Roseibacillus ishigakijimensis]